MQGAGEERSRGGWTRDGREHGIRRTDGVGGVQEGWGGGRAGLFEEDMLFFVLVTKNKQKILNTVHYFFLVLSSLLLWEKRKERGGKEQEWQEGKKIEEM